MARINPGNDKNTSINVTGTNNVISNLHAETIDCHDSKNLRHKETANSLCYSALQISKNPSNG
jgi:hypothetical protein